MAPLLTFNVLGTPAPQGSKIPRVSKSGKPYVQEQNVEAHSNWRQDVLKAASIARQAANLETIREVGVWVDIEFRMPRPPSVSIKRRPYPCVKPDGDKLQRNTWDALVQAGVIGDDALIVNWRASKRYATDDPLGSPGATIRVGLVPLPEII